MRCSYGKKQACENQNFGWIFLTSADRIAIKFTDQILNLFAIGGSRYV
jgi:hypothetical protein